MGLLNSMSGEKNPNADELFRVLRKVDCVLQGWDRGRAKIVMVPKR